MLYCNLVGQAIRCLPESKHLPNRWCCMMSRAVLCSGNVRPKNSRPKSNRRFLLFHVWAPFSAILLVRYQVPKDLKKISDCILTPKKIFRRLSQTCFIFILDSFLFHQNFNLVSSLLVLFAARKVAQVTTEMLSFEITFHYTAKQIGAKAPLLF